jgi:hypothetical protein
MLTGTGVSGILDQYGNPVAAPAPSPGAPQTARQAGFKSAGSAALQAAGVAAVISGIGLITELDAISKDKTLSEEERNKRRGGAGGEFVGNVAGTAIGAAIGTLILPGIGTMMGSMIGAQLGGMAGRWGGEKLGAWKNKTEKELEDAQKQYEEACREAADVTGKTAEEILLINQRMDESRARLEKAKEAKDTEDLKKEKQRKVTEQLAERHMQGRRYRPTSEQPPTVPPPQTTWTGAGFNVDAAKEAGKRWAGRYEPAAVPPPQTTRTGAGFNADAAKEAGKWWAGMYMPTADLPPQITQTKTEFVPLKAELEGQAAIDVNVNLSGERPTAQVNVRDNSIRNMRFNTGHAPWARDMAL